MEDGGPLEGGAVDGLAVGAVAELGREGPVGVEDVLVEGAVAGGAEEGW